MQIIDSHCHLNFDGLRERLPEVFANMRANNVVRALAISVSRDSFEQVLAIAEQYDHVYATVGIHPDSETAAEFSLDELLQHARHPKVVGIGETGLDYHWCSGDLTWQHNRFITHIQAANQSGLPLIIHTRKAADDKSGDYLAEALQGAGHILQGRQICRDEKYDIRAAASAAIADPAVEVLLITGGTGMFDRDITPDAVEILFDRAIPGFGEVFRAVSLQEIGMSTIQSRAVAGIANRTLIFCLPGSTGACRTAWEKVIAPQLDPRINSCGFTRVFNAWGK